MRSLVPVLAALALVTTSAPAATYDSPGTYPVTLVAFSGLLPPDVLPPGTPVVGPTIYEGELRIQDKPHGTLARFKGRSADGHRVNIMAHFNHQWAGVTTGMVPVNGTLVEAVIDMDHLNLNGGRLHGTVSVEGEEQKVRLLVGSGGTLLQLDVR